MFDSQRTLARVQIQRPLIQPETETPVKDAFLEGFRRRNAFLDAFFYDVGTINEREASSLSPWLAREGTLLIVPPSNKGPVAVCKTIADFKNAGGREIRILTVAGVGSSALGSAAFARNVADAFGKPVAAVVSGYGMSDLMTEALGGWFWFGSINRMRHAFEQFDDIGRTSMQPPPTTGANSTQATGIALAEISLDTKMLCALLTDTELKFSLLTGHSKGNLVISEALEAVVGNGGDAPAFRPDDWVVTVSAAVAMPKRQKKIIDVMGTADPLGAMNSTFGIKIDKRCPLKGHHTNTEVPFHLPVTEVFSELIQSHGLRS